MNREIKFRAWDGRQMSYDVTIANGRFIVVDDDGETLFYWHDPSEQLAIMQFTGFKDINKIEIYEGDILLCHEYDSSDCGQRIAQTFKNAVVGFQFGSFYYYPKGNMNQPHQLLMFAYKPEIIGNIYNNPELLNA